MKKTLSIIALVILSVFVFYLLNFDFKGTFSGTFRSICDNTFGQKSEIPTSWLKRYSIDLENESETESDVDDDGLTLLAEYENSTNPLNPDTDGDGYGDGKEVRDGYNPIGEGKLDTDQDGLPDFWETEVGLSIKENDRDKDQDQDMLPNYLEFAHHTDPFKKDSDGDSFSDAQEIKNGYDPTAAGDVRPNFSLSIQKIDVDAPIVWSKSLDDKELLKDLEEGVVRLPATGVPTQNGNTVISGHSSNYLWAKGEYNHIFKKINNLELGDKITIKTTQRNGKSFEHNFVIKNKDVVKADDPSIFESSEEPVVTLVTCWPLNTTWKRLVIRATLEKE
ncbi:sortase [bacterium]|nr:sortase [bacterium]MBT4598144.1 sortase [bacterium]